MQNLNAGITKIASGTLFIYLGLLFGAVLDFFGRIIIVRYYGAEAFGYFALSLGFLSMIASIALLGFGKSVSRYLAHWIDEPEKRRGTFLYAIYVVVPASIFLSLIAFFGV